MINYIRSKLSRVIEEGSEEQYLSGVLKKSGHYVRMYSDAERYVLEISNKKTFDRWANSCDISTYIYFHWTKEEQKKKINDTLKLSDILFKSIPSKYWNELLRVHY